MDRQILLVVAIKVSQWEERNKNERDWEDGKIQWETKNTTEIEKKQQTDIYLSAYKDWQVMRNMGKYIFSKEKQHMVRDLTLHRNNIKKQGQTVHKTALKKKKRRKPVKNNNKHFMQSYISILSTIVWLKIEFDTSVL